jgi:hypothetical protein
MVFGAYWLSIRPMLRMRVGLAYADRLLPEVLAVAVLELRDRRAGRRMEDPAELLLRRYCSLSAYFAPSRPSNVGAVVVLPVETSRASGCRRRRGEDAERLLHAGAGHEALLLGDAVLVRQAIAHEGFAAACSCAGSPSRP